MIFIRPNVKLTDTIKKVLAQIEPYSGDVILDITSGLRTPSEQLMIIARYAAVHGVQFHEFLPDDVHSTVMIDDKQLYCWQRTWSRLLSMGIIINPPLAAVVLDDYIVAGENRKGHLIPGSPHYGGKAFDIAARKGPDIIVKVLQAARDEGADIRSWTIERKNNCVHVDCK